MRGSVGFVLELTWHPLAVDIDCLSPLSVHVPGIFLTRVRYRAHDQ